MTNNNNLVPVVNAILQDTEFLRGGIFSKEQYYADKYNLTLEQIGQMQTYIYYALNIKTDDNNH